MSDHADRALPARRAYVVDNDRLQGVVLEIDATDQPNALAVLQAGLHELPAGERLIYGYDVSVVGLGAWVGDKRLRLTVWPAFIDEAGDISAEDLDDPDADVLVIDVDPLEHGETFAELARLGRVFIAGPEAGPVPLVVDLDADVLGPALEQLRPD